MDKKNSCASAEVVFHLNEKGPFLLRLTEIICVQINRLCDETNMNQDYINDCKTKRNILKDLSIHQ